MKVHHFNCGSFCPRLGNAVVTHCLLVETPRDGLLLVDTGFGDTIIADPQRLPWAARWQLRPRFLAHESATRRVRALGHRPSDVRHIVVTHLDGDHAGGIVDFPNASVHIHAPELEALRSNSVRYDPTLRDAAVDWRPYGVDGDRWHGFACVRPIAGLRDDVATIPLVGHTEGHAGVAIRSESGWLLHAGDAYLLASEIREPRTLGWQTRLAAWLTSSSPRLRHENVARLRSLARSHPEIAIFSSHDPAELAPFDLDPRPTVSGPTLREPSGR